MKILTLIVTAEQEEMFTVRTFTASDGVMVLATSVSLRLHPNASRLSHSWSLFIDTSFKNTLRVFTGYLLDKLINQAKNVSASDKTEMKEYVARFEDTFLKGLYKGLRIKRRDIAERMASVTTDF